MWSLCASSAPCPPCFFVHPSSLDFAPGIADLTWDDTPVAMAPGHGHGHSLSAQPGTPLLAGMDDLLAGFPSVELDAVGDFAGVAAEGAAPTAPGGGDDGALHPVEVAAGSGAVAVGEAAKPEDTAGDGGGSASGVVVGEGAGETPAFKSAEDARVCACAASQPLLLFLAGSQTCPPPTHLPPAL